jgi:uncharacterized protein (TIGR03435 family)
MTVDKDGFPILIPGQRQAGRFGNGVVHSTFRMYTMSDFVIDLESLINMANGDSAFSPVHVVDRTGLTGQYDFKLQSAGEVVLPNRPAQGATSNSNIPSNRSISSSSTASKKLPQTTKNPPVLRIPHSNRRVFPYPRIFRVHP